MTTRMELPSYADDHTDDEDGTTGVVNLARKKAEEVAKERAEAEERLKEKMRKLRESCGSK